MCFTVAPDQQHCLYKMHAISIHNCNSFILSASMNITFARDHLPSNHLPCLSQQSYLRTCAYKHVCLIHLHRTRIHMCYSNIQPSVLSVALAPDQYKSNGFYNCTGPAGLYQPAVKIETSICSMQISYSGIVFCVDTLRSISKYFFSVFINLIHPSKYNFPADFFPHINLKKCLYYG